MSDQRLAAYGPHHRSRAQQAGRSRHDIAIKIPTFHILSPLLATKNSPRCGFSRSSGIADGEDAVADQVDFTQEANGCFRLAEAETHDEVKTILMAMGYGWLTLADRHRAGGKVNQEPVDEPTEEPVDDLV